jgi:hypothetical protein
MTQCRAGVDEGGTIIWAEGDDDPVPADPLSVNAKRPSGHAFSTLSMVTRSKQDLYSFRYNQSLELVMLKYAASRVVPGGKKCHVTGLPKWNETPLRPFSCDVIYHGSSGMKLSVLALAGVTFFAAGTMAIADDNGALTGAVGGAVTGAVVGGPVGAVVGGAAGAAIGGAATGSPRPVVVEPEGPPCATRTQTTTNNNTGASRTTQTTDCAN